MFLSTKNTGFFDSIRLLFFMAPLLILECSAQKAFSDQVFKDNIKTVLLHRKGWELTYPILQLNSSEKLILRFDELGDEGKTYNYTFIQCNANWTESDLSQSEYLEGFYEGQINDYTYSFNTKVNYTHYRLEIPNENMPLNMSGNYVIKVYEDFDPEKPVLTKRFFVYDPMVDIHAMVKRPSMAMHHETHHEVDFTINHKGMDIRDPYQDITVVIMQNMVWDNAIVDLKPLFVKPGLLDYNYSEENLFPAINEFRYFNSKSVRFMSEKIKDITYDHKNYHFWLFPENMRPFEQYFYYEDINGKYLVEVQEENNNHTDADYVNVHFYLKYNIPEADGDVYVYGGLTDWQIREENKMEYNFETNSYTAGLMLKQGYYNYHYAYKLKEEGTLDLSRIEGSHYETENDYLIFVYYKPNISRHEQLIGVKVVNSLNQ